ncbi:MAG TPA: dockerin type I repeat-containing protein, partial [Tepidisphaeraceae bacterium]|nr:dockerin type I repeat-containing protein [Tepidisphaeraceae bacterium]
WAAPPSDIEGYNRVDDPGTPNTGSPNYFESNLGTSSFVAGGLAKNWRVNYDAYFSLTLPFSFPFYGNNYSTAYVSSQGFIEFNTTLGSIPNSDAALEQNVVIAPLWASLRTDLTGNDIFVDTSTTGQITIRWNATNTKDGSPVNFSLTLFSSGQIQFNYGSGNTNLTPTIGISSGNTTLGGAYVLSAYDGQTGLTNAASLQYNLSPGVADLGAYEFRGSSSDTTLPVVVSTTPSGVGSDGSASEVGQIQVAFNKPLNDIDASAPGNFQLDGAGPDGQFGTADDTYYTLVPIYTGNSTLDTIMISGAVSASGQQVPWNGQLPLGLYRFTVYSNPTGAGIHDLSGLKLDGTSQGVQGGNYVRTFSVVALPSLDTVTGTGASDQISLIEDADHQHIDWTVNGGTLYQLPINDPNGLTINGNGGNDIITLDYTNGNPLPNTLHLNGNFTINGLQGTNPLADTSLDIGRGTVFISYTSVDPISAIKSYLQNGYANGAWNGTPTSSTGVITSSAAAANHIAGKNTTAIGYADSADGQGVNTKPNTIELTYTLYGDANLDHQVNSADLQILLASLNRTGAWDQSDFNYDGQVNSADLQDLLFTLNTNLGSQAAPATALTTATPATTAAVLKPSASSQPRPSDKPLLTSKPSAPTAAAIPPSHHHTTARRTKRRHP